MPVLLILICLILPSTAVKADPAELFINLLNSATAIQSGEHLLPPQITFSASTANVMLNQEFELQWQSRYASGCSANGAWQGDKETSGTHKVVSTGAGPQTFQLICFGDKGSESAEVVVIGLSEGLDEWSGTKVPSYMDGTPTEFELFDNSAGGRYILTEASGKRTKIELNKGNYGFEMWAPMASFRRPASKGTHPMP